MSQPDNRKTRQIIIAVIIIVIFIAACIAMFPLGKLLSSEEGQEFLTEKLKQFGWFAPLIFVAVQVIQVVIAVIPGGPVPMIGGVLFGEWGALFLCISGFFLGTVIVYYLVQAIGKPIVNLFVTEQHSKRFSFLSNQKKLELIVFLIFLCPGLPKDALTYIVSFTTKIKPMRLFFITTIARTPATVLTIFLGGSLRDGNYTLSIVFALAMAIVAVIGFYLNKKIYK